jgi:ATP-dependent Clp protease protease subunit
MIHQPLGGAQGQATDIEIQAREILHLKEQQIQILAKHTGKDADRLRLDMERNFWMSSEDAREYGMVDAVLTHQEQKGPSGNGTQGDGRAAERDEEALEESEKA